MFTSRFYFFVASAALLSLASLLHGQTLAAEWLNPVSGNWTDAAKWSTNSIYPDSNSISSASQYNVAIDVDGGGDPYTVTLDEGVIVKNLHLEHSILELINGSSIWFAMGDSSLISGTGELVANGTSTQEIQSFGTEMTIGSDVSIRTGSGHMLVWHRGNTLINYGTLSAGTTGKEISISAKHTENYGRVESSNGGLLRINASDSNGTFDNYGEIVIDGASMRFDSSFRNFGTITAMNGARVYLHGAYTLTNLGNHDWSDSVVQLSGSLDLEGDTYNLEEHWEFGGDLRNGTVTTSTGAEIRSLDHPGNVIGNLTLGVDLQVTSNTTIDVSGDLTLGGTTVRIGGQSSSSTAATALRFSGSRLDGVGTVIFESRGTANNSIGGVTLGSGIVVRTGTGDGSIGAINDGLVSAETAGRTIEFGGTNRNLIQGINEANIRLIGARNEANVTIIDGGTLTVDGGLINTGVIKATNAIVRIGSPQNTGTSFQLQDLGDLRRENSPVRLFGTLNNTGAQLELDSFSGEWQMETGGKIIGGEISSTDGTSLVALPSERFIPRIDGVRLSTGLKLNSEAILEFINDLELNDASIVLEAGNTSKSTRLLSVKTQSIKGSGEIVFAGTANTNSIGITDGVLTLGEDIVVRAVRGGGIGSEFEGTLNNGTIRNDGPHRLSLTGTNFVNEGLIESVNGGSITATRLVNNGIFQVDGGSASLQGVWSNANEISVENATLEVNGAWANSGSISVEHGTFNLAGKTTAIGSILVNDSVLNIQGSYTTAQIQELMLSESDVAIQPGGLLDNASNTLDLSSAGGVWTMVNGGQISGGTIVSTAGNALNFNRTGTLQNVVVNADLSVSGDNPIIRISGNVQLGSGHSVTGEGIIALSGQFRSVEGDLIISPTITVASWQSNAVLGHGSHDVKNLGKIEAESYFLTIAANRFQNEANFDVVDDSTATVSASLFENSGSVAVYDLSDLVINGTFRQTPDGTLLLDARKRLQSPYPWVARTIAMDVNGNAELGGTLQIHIDQDLPNQFSVGDAVDIITFDSHTGSFSTILGREIGNGLFFDPVYDADSLTLFVEQAGQGDADFDGDVDLSDLSALAANYGEQSGKLWSQGDYDGDGDVDLSDLSILAANYGSGEAQAFADFAAIAAVPEPWSAGLLILFAGWAAQRRK